MEKELEPVLLGRLIVRGDLKRIGEGLYQRVVDDPYLEGHKKGDVYKVGPVKEKAKPPVKFKLKGC